MSEISSQQNDKEILDLVKQDLQYFSIFYEKYFERVYKYCNIKMNYRKAETEDIVSQVFLKAVENIQELELEKYGKTSILPWLYTIARNLIFDTWKKKGKVDSMSLDDEDVDIERIEDRMSSSDTISKLEKRLDRKQLSDKVKAAIKELDPETAEIIYLKIYEELTFKEIGKEMDKSESAVKMRYYRAIDEVTKTLEIEL